MRAGDDRKAETPTKQSRMAKCVEPVTRSAGSSPQAERVRDSREVQKESWNV